MKNIYGEVVKPQYEVAIQRHVEGSVDDDFESVDFVDASNYRDGAKKAKNLSLSDQYGDCKQWRIALICYYSDDVSTYNQAWEDIYIKGKKVERYEF